MKKIFLISGFIVYSLIGMSHQDKMQKVVVDTAQLKFKQKFFPSVVSTHCNDVGNCCRIYMNVSCHTPVMGDISFAAARTYACHHRSAQSEIFIRYSNEFMQRVYNLKSSYKEAISKIESDEKLMCYILTGQDQIYTQQELQEIKESFKKVVREYAAKTLKLSAA